MTVEAEVVDLKFPFFASSAPVGAATIPADHGYLLYSALAARLAWLHDAEDVGVHPLGGAPVGDRLLLPHQSTGLVLRLPANRVREALVLAGKSLRVEHTELRIGAPSSHRLKPAPSLFSRLVTIAGKLDAESLLASVRARLDDIGVKGEAALLRRQRERPLEPNGRGSRDPFLRRTIRIKSRTIVGYAVIINGLDGNESTAVQAAGIGGRRRFGCGIFVPGNGD